ncbi:DNA polymerase delta subunit 1 [Rhodotorula toruloides]|uniref:DNA polymerase n=1 Tax=Rhodotorula toruloides TaxID=5286 RepID=A0A511K7V3_RHOTO|nr:DNA polymerase delta subunit 1 [Rhodotorula toruloides]
MAPLPALIIVMGASGCGKSTVGLGIATALGVPFVDGDDLHPAANVAKMSAGTPLTDEDRIPWLHKIRETAILLTSHDGLAALDRPAVTPSPSEVDSAALSHELHAAVSRVQAPSINARLETRQRAEKRKREAVVVACSALTVQYRNLLRGEEARFVLPNGKEITVEEHLDPHIETFFVYLQGTRPLLLNRMEHRAGHFMKASMLDSQLATLQEPHETDEVNVTIVKLGQGEGEAEERGKEAVIADAVARGEPATVAGEPTADANLATQQDIPDEDHAAPPSSAAGAHAKPLSALFQAKTPSPKKKKRTVDLRQAGRIGDEDKENFTALLARLNKETPQEEAEKWGRPNAPKLNPQRDGLVFQQIDIEEFSAGGGAPTIRAFGVTKTGNSVLLHVKGFLPYFWVSAPRGFTSSDCLPFMEHLNAAHFNGVRPVKAVSLANKRSLWGYKGDAVSPFIKVTVMDTKQYPKVRNAFERGEVLYKDFFNGTALMTYESNIAYTLRFMIDYHIVGMNWLELKPGTYERAKNPVSNCQYEIECQHDKLISHPAEGEWSGIAPLRILSFDIECAGRKGIFPEPEIDPVIQIANMVTRQGDSKPFIRNVFTLNTCAHIVGSDVLEFKKEADLLSQWRKFVEEVDPDLIIGYNTSQFDFPYLMDRAKALKVSDFPYFSRLKGVKTEVKDTHFSSKAYGTRDSKETSMDGRLQLDILQVMQRDYKLRSYTLNSVCAHFLGEQKEDVHHSVITDLQNGTAESRRRLAVYCLKDAYLPQRLMDKLMCFINYTEMARVTGIPFNYLLSRGQQIKVISQLYRQALKTGYVIPALKQEGSDEQYEGATVLEPEQGYYDVPIATLDFASLYPSIMQAHNLCYTTLLDVKIAQALNLKEGEDFVSANSVYGFTGATIGKLPCLPISMSVTAYGREMIDQTKEVVQSTYNTANGYDYDAKVIYGDTDSVMVRFGCPDLETAMRLGAEAAEFVTSKFIKPIKLEFEKVYFPYLLISKKRYAGLYWTKPEKYDKMDTKGIETVRRDNCRLVVTVIDTCLRKMLIERDVRGAEEYAKQVISDLLQNKVDLSQLVITKALAKADYAAKQAHVELAERMKKRDAGSAPAMGDRVAYVIIKGTKDARAYEKSEDPLYVLENNIPIDTKYYLDNQLSKPLMRIFEPILGEKASSLLAGDHTRTVSIVAPTVGGLMKFAVKTVTCLGCRTPLRPNALNQAVCNNCRPRTAELHAKQVSIAAQAETAYARLWTQCQRCQGSLHQDVLCTSKDCPIFYMRKKAQKEAVDAVGTLKRFDGEW